ncbi:MAG: hypothetical protein L6R38_003480 [Xanthoria sp. 2 TBL-2021]|nr:MAG: hypothetical protein L6R38_003480 [Xanthoria sp. 2 TBL-2021]
MCDKISTCEPGKLVKLRNAFVAVTVDIVTEYSFGQCAGALQGPDFSTKWEKMMSGVTEAVPLAMFLPGIVQALAILPKHVIRMTSPLMSAFFDYRDVSHDNICPRKSLKSVSHRRL